MFSTCSVHVQVHVLTNLNLNGWKDRCYRGTLLLKFKSTFLNPCLHSFRKSTGISGFKACWTPPSIARCMTQCATGWCWKRLRRQCGREECRAYRWRTATKRIESIWLPMLFPIHLSPNHTMHVTAILCPSFLHTLRFHSSQVFSAPQGTTKKKEEPSRYKIIY